MTAWPTRFESSVCQTPSTPVTIGIATMPATSPMRSPISTVACAASTCRPDRGVEHLAQQERRDDAERRRDHDQPGDEPEPRACSA